MTLSSELIAKPVARVAWTADTAFVHHQDSTHLALPIVDRSESLVETSPVSATPLRKHEEASLAPTTVSD